MQVLVKIFRVCSDNYFLSGNLSQGICQNVLANTITHTSNEVLIPEVLAKTWHIGLHVAKQTLKTTSQDSMRILSGKIHRRVRKYAH